ncbi:hypothetical protein GE09DRAFT_1224769 [Coniochaeta sp. 2T2.1]|nr:hypothetical protein GE09DRAFT_1224769 [Coniochaeta sp. 2T2.1]
MSSTIATTFKLLAVGAVTLAAPGNLSNRQDVAEHCVDDNLGYMSYKNLYCVTSDGTIPRCYECLGTCGSPPQSAALGATCYITNGGEDGDLGIRVACPGDPPPTATPDGSDPGQIAGDFLHGSLCDAFAVGLCTCFKVDLCDQEAGGGTG